MIAVVLLLLAFAEASTFSPPLQSKNIQNRFHARRSTHCPTGLPYNDTQEKYSAKTTALNLFGGAFVQPAVPSSIGGIMGAIDVFYRNYPALSAMATCSVKGCLADVIAQKRNRGEDGKSAQKISLKRNLCYIVYSALGLGLMSEVMYNHVYPILFGVGSKASHILALVGFDCFVSAPLIWLPPLYFVKALLYGKSLRSGGENYIKDAKSGLLMSYWRLWIPVQLINFWRVPKHLRVAFMAGVSFFWLIILSCFSSNKKTEIEQAPADNFS